MLSKQEGVWDSSFGANYTDRNELGLQTFDEIYREEFGITRSEMNKLFLEHLNLKDERILEVGCNVGEKLQFLQNDGYNNLYGIDIQWYAIEKAKENRKGINLVQGSAFDMPFKNNYFELVYTSVMLIHISPDDINKVLDEVYRCSDKYIWGFEYYSPQYEEIHYRGNNDLCWKADYAQLYLDRFDDLEMVKKEFYTYKSTKNTDCMFLLKKKGR